MTKNKSLALISIVIPIYQSQKQLSELIEQLKIYLNLITERYEIILVDDGSSDRSWQIIKNVANKDLRIKGVKFQKNFGQNIAIYAGLKMSRGSWIVIMDADFQDAPKDIIRLFNEAKKGFDIVFAARDKNHYSLTKKFTSKLFYKITEYLSGYKINNRIGNFGIYHKKVIDYILKNPTKITYIPIIIKFESFKKNFIDVSTSSEFENNSTYSYFKLLKLAINVIMLLSSNNIKTIFKISIIIFLFFFMMQEYSINIKIILFLLANLTLHIFVVKKKTSMDYSIDEIINN